MKKYVIEIDMNVEVLDEREEAEKKFDVLVGTMCDYDKQNSQYIRLYEVEAENLDDVDDLMDVCTEMIKMVKQVIGMAYTSVEREKT